ncbi:MAG: hypothetical protein VB980_05490 [Opitutales bacterium]|jgi:membrane-bound serine protease (ClpP class)
MNSAILRTALIASLSFGSVALNWPDRPTKSHAAPEGNLSDAGIAPDIHKVKVHVIPIHGESGEPIAIGPPVLDILRRGLKDAIRAKSEVVILDIDTPGGELGVTLEMMEAIDRFTGTTIAYVNNEAISAGAYISISADEIAFAPKSLIGAAEAVSGGGQDIDLSMKRKINSYLKGKIRNYAGKYRYRARVMAAMMDSNSTLEIDGERPTTADGSFIQNYGDLLSLTAKEAIQEYGSPPQSLLGSGIYDSIEDLLKDRYGENGFVIKEMKLSWSENLGLYLNSIGPVIMGIGMLLLIIEFKTPGFGLPGVSGIILMLVFFGSKYVAGLAGYEEVLIFLLGVSLVFVEILLLPGAMIFALLGVACMLGSLLWAMVDVWPTPDFELSIGMFYDPFIDLGLGLLVTITCGFALARFLPQSMFWDKLVLANSVGRADPLVTGGARGIDKPNKLPEIGAKGHTTSHLFPSGTVEINGNLYQAQVKLGSLQANQAIRVVQHSHFNLVVEIDEEA